MRNFLVLPLFSLPLMASIYPIYFQKVEHLYECVAYSITISSRLKEDGFKDIAKNFTKLANSYDQKAISYANIIKSKKGLKEYAEEKVQAHLKNFNDKKSLDLYNTHHQKCLNLLKDDLFTK